MRIAAISRYGHVIAGTEVYLRNVLPELARQGNTVSLWHELPTPTDLQSLFSAESYCVSTIGAEAALRRLAEWAPNVIYNNGCEDETWEAGLHSIAPVVQFVHSYRGTCISGEKTWKYPNARPCSEKFGAKCLLHYFPHRCGGLSPLTMIRLYSTEQRRLEMLRRCAAVVTASEHMRQEYLLHGFATNRVVTAGLFLQSRSGCNRRESGEAVRLLFCGRMIELKGCLLFLDALSIVGARLKAPIEGTFVGDGPLRQECERRAEAIRRKQRNVQIEFAGWRPSSELPAFYQETDLLVFPSVWPEPFGLAGPEAGRYGIPAIAFDVGGVRDWLIDGVNGQLAKGPIPSARTLADAIVDAVADPEHLARLRQGAVEMASRLTIERHLERLVPILASAARKNEALRFIS